MRRTTLSSLPVEIHFEILKQALYSAWEESEYRYRPVFGDDGYIIAVETVKIDKLLQFPYNAAAVCKLWFAVLTKIPGCWTRVAFDLATDPSKFLDIFLWSKNLTNIEITVFNTHEPESEDEDYSSLERDRVSAIVNALRPHISRCESITFDVKFLTSLPSPVIFLNGAPYLEELVLECKFNNAGPPDDYSRTCDIGVSEAIPTLSPPPELKNLSLTGFWFMFAASHPYTSEWFEQVSAKDSCSFSRIQFQKEGLFTIQKFVEFCSTIESKAITLSDLSLNHDGPVFEGDEYDDDVFSGPLRNKVDFKNVSADVIQTLFFLADFSPSDILTFDNCLFPYQALPHDSSSLCLKNIQSPIPAGSTSTSRETDANLVSILQDWTGTSLHVISCPSFHDEVLSSLPGREESTMLVLYLKDCNNFTVPGLRQYLERKNNPRRRPSYTGDRLQNLKVRGTHCAFPSKEDQKWFRESDYTENMREIDWRVENPENSKFDQIFYMGIYEHDM